MITCDVYFSEVLISCPVSLDMSMSNLFFSPVCFALVSEKVRYPMMTEVAYVAKK